MINKTRVCKLCKEVKDINRFYRRTKGYASECRDCQNKTGG